MALTEGEMFAILFVVAAAVFLTVSLICYLLTSRRRQQQKEEPKKCRLRVSPCTGRPQIVLQTQSSKKESYPTKPSEPCEDKFGYHNPCYDRLDYIPESRNTAVRAKVKSPKPTTVPKAGDPIASLDVLNAPRPGNGDIILIPPAAPPREVHA